MNQRPYRGVKPPPSLVKGTERFEKLYALSQGNPRHKTSTTIQPAEPLPCYRFFELPAMSISKSYAPGAHPHLDYTGQLADFHIPIQWLDSGDHSKYYPFRLRDTRVSYQVRPTRFEYTCTIDDQVNEEAIYYDGYARIYLTLWDSTGAEIEPRTLLCSFSQFAGGSGGETVAMLSETNWQAVPITATHPQQWESPTDPVTTLRASGVGLVASLFTNASITVNFDKLIIMEYEVGL